ncbi:Ger(x)C family spore germination protein [Paenibacillus polymyxa]|uniref:Ger(x)C family spore germination protein n=1 Tax=Paenibacillus polymyxa TaxID=1406 RepID=UPI001BE74638|nr:Ger(x)C family spore germination protein [Paenibacillus polymyxa]MBT2282798.1 Ger(x)C family spore germination protein [Paenibacillus polymyxa]
MKTIKRAILVTWCAVLMLLSGCWDNSELNDQAIQLSVGVDWTDHNTYLLSNQFALNAESADGQSQPQEGFYTEKAEGATPMQALSVMQSKVTRSINRGQRRSLVIGEKMAKKGFGHIIDFLLRNAESPLRMDLIVVKNGKASDMLKSKTPFGAQSLREYYKLHQTNYGPVNTTFISLVRNMNEGRNVAFLMPAVEKIKDVSKKEEGKEAAFLFSGAAVLDNDTKLIGFLNIEETNNNLWIINWRHRHVITVKAPDGTGTVSAELNGMKSVWKLNHTTRGNPNILLSLSAKCDIVENTSTVDLLNAKSLDQIQGEMQKEVERQMKHLIFKYQDEFKKDALGVGNYLYRNHPKLWRTFMDRWEEVFQEVDISLQIKLKVTRFGLTGSGGYLKPEDVSDPH